MPFVVLDFDVISCAVLFWEARYVKAGYELSFPHQHRKQICHSKLSSSVAVIMNFV